MMCISLIWKNNVDSSTIQKFYPRCIPKNSESVHSNKTLYANDHCSITHNGYKQPKCPHCKYIKYDISKQ